MNQKAKPFVELATVTLCAITCLLIIGCLAYFATYINKNSNLRPTGALEYNRFSSAASSTNKTVTSTSGQIMGTSTDRTYCIFGNSGTNAVFLNMDADKIAVASKGVLLNASSTYEITPDKMYFGAVQAVSAISTNVTVYCR